MLSSSINCRYSHIGHIEFMQRHNDYEGDWEPELSADELLQDVGLSHHRDIVVTHGNDCKSRQGESNHILAEDSLSHKAVLNIDAERARLDKKLKSRFEAIFEKYGKDFDGVGDEIDLVTGNIVVDNGHLARMADHHDDTGDEEEEEDVEEVVVASVSENVINPLHDVQVPTRLQILAQFGAQLGPQIADFVAKQTGPAGSEIEVAWRCPELPVLTNKSGPILEQVLQEPALSLGELSRSKVVARAPAVPGIELECQTHQCRRNINNAIQGRSEGSDDNFTEEDDATLIAWVNSEVEKGTIFSVRVWESLAEKHPRHSGSSWRKRYKRRFWNPSSKPLNPHSAMYRKTKASNPELVVSRSRPIRTRTMTRHKDKVSWTDAVTVIAATDPVLYAGLYEDALKQDQPLHSPDLSSYTKNSNGSRNHFEHNIHTVTARGATIFDLDPKSSKGECSQRVIPDSQSTPVSQKLSSSIPQIDDEVEQIHCSYEFSDDDDNEYYNFIPPVEPVPRIGDCDGDHSIANAVIEYPQIPDTMQKQNVDLEISNLTAIDAEQQQDDATSNTNFHVFRDKMYKSSTIEAACSQNNLTETPKKRLLKDYSKKSPGLGKATPYAHESIGFSSKGVTPRSATKLKRIHQPIDIPKSRTPRAIPAHLLALADDEDEFQIEGLSTHCIMGSRNFRGTMAVKADRTTSPMHMSKLIPACSKRIESNNDHTTSSKTALLHTVGLLDADVCISAPQIGATIKDDHPSGEFTTNPEVNPVNTDAEVVEFTSALSGLIEHHGIDVSRNRLLEDNANTSCSLKIMQETVDVISETIEQKNNMSLKMLKRDIDDKQILVSVNAALTTEAQIENTTRKGMMDVAGDALETAKESYNTVSEKTRSFRDDSSSLSSLPSLSPPSSPIPLSKYSESVGYARERQPQRLTFSGIVVEITNFVPSSTQPKPRRNDESLTEAIAARTKKFTSHSQDSKSPTIARTTRKRKRESLLVDGPLPTQDDEALETKYMLRSNGDILLANTKEIVSKGR